MKIEHDDKSILRVAKGYTSFDAILRCPHECNISDCPGDLNRRKLEMWREVVDLCDDLTEQGWTRINAHRAQVVSEKAKALK